MLNTIYLVHHSHMDIGFTDLAEEVRQQHLRHMDLALELCDQSQADETLPNFCWTIESSWIVQDYLRLRGRQQIERLLSALRRGQLELQAFYAQPLTELASAEESIDSVRFAAELGAKHGFPVQCAMLNDIGGYMARLPSVLNGWGVQYLVAGVGSYQVHMPWCDLPHLFYLQDKAGGRILVWNLGIDRTKTPQQMTMLDAVYSMGGTYLISPFAEETSGIGKGNAEGNAPSSNARFKGVSESYRYLADRLNNENYPYEQVMLQYGKDNGAPDAMLASLLKSLNQRKDIPHVELTTPLHFFKAMEQQYAGKIPVLSGVITDPWVSRVNPQPAPLAQHRAAQRRLLAAETRTAVGGLAIEKHEEAWESLHLYTDHTHGLNEWDWPESWKHDPNCRAATFDRYRQSWRDKARYAEMALHRANEIDRDARERMMGQMTGLHPAVIVWNDRAHSANGLVELTVPRQQQASLIKSLHDPATNKSVRFQRIAAKRYLIDVENVPPLGYRILRPQWEDESVAWQNPNDHALSSCPATMESDRLKLSLDPTTGAIRQVTDKQTGQTWLTENSTDAGDGHGYGLGEFRYARVANVSQTWEFSGMADKIEHHWIPGKLTRAWQTLDGPLKFSLSRERVFTSGVISGVTSGGDQQTVRVIEQISLYPGQARLDFCYRLDKPETAAKESCYINFDFDLPDATFRYDQAVGWIEPKNDLMTGAMQDAFLAAQWADLSTASRGVTLVCHEAPLLQVGRVRTYEWRDTLPFLEGGSTLIAWPYHNLAQTDNPIWQDVLMDIHYSVFLHSNGGFNPTRCDRDADTALRPLRAQLASVRPDMDHSRSGIALASQTVRWVGCRLLTDNQTICVRLEERSGQDTEAVLHFGSPLSSAYKADSFFNDQQKGQLLNTNDECVSIPMKPFELATILIRLKKPSKRAAL